MAEDEVRIEHPNREKAASKATKAVVILLLLVSAALVAIVTVGGWDALEGAKPVQIGYIAVYLVIAFYVGRWNRGVLPVAAALAIVLLIFAAVAGPGWFDRDRTGFEDPALDSSLLGLVTKLVRRAALKRPWPSGHVGSSPTPGTRRSGEGAALTLRYGAAWNAFRLHWSAWTALRMSGSTRDASAGRATARSTPPCSTRRSPCSTSPATAG